jgi:hypothetical protein
MVFGELILLKRYMDILLQVNCYAYGVKIVLWWCEQCEQKRVDIDERKSIKVGKCVIKGKVDGMSGEINL